MKNIPQPSFKRFIVNKKDAEGCVLASSLAALHAGRGFRLLFPGTHIKCRVKYGPALPGVWLQQKPQEVRLLVLRKPPLPV